MLDPNKGPLDFKTKEQFRLYAQCVAKHILDEFCEECPFNYYEKENEKPTTEQEGQSIPPTTP